jgi:hypothetical protein
VKVPKGSGKEFDHLIKITIADAGGEGKGSRSHLIYKGSHESSASQRLTIA